MTIEKFPIALKSELREVDRNLKREVANLNLQLEANKRVKNGVTFGTNFADSFGMEIDMARTSSDEALEVGQTVITVKDTSGFKIGTEVTVFDDVNLERVNIASVSGNVITLGKALTKGYKKGVNIARSMTVQRKLSNAMVFGAWGSYEYKELDYLTPWRTADKVGHEASFANIQDKWFFTAGKKLFSLGMDEKEEPVLIRDDYYASYPVIISDDKFAYVAGFEPNDIMSVRVYNYEGVEVSRLEHTYAKAHQEIKIGIDKDRKHLYVLTGTNGSGSTVVPYTILRKYRYDNNGSLTLLNEYEHHMSAVGDYTVSNGLLSFQFDDSGNMYCLLKKDNGSRSTLLLVRYNSELTGHNVLPLWSAEKAETITNCQLYQDTSGIYKAVAGTRSKVYVYSSETLGAFSPASEEKVFSYGGSPYATLDNILYIVGASVITKWDFLNSEPSTIKTFSAEEKLAITNPVAFIPDYDFTGEVPIFLSANTQLGIFGKGELGYGAPLLVNDIRFKTKPSKEVVTWLQHDEGLTVTEATFGNINLDLSTLENETQAVGYTTKEQDEVRLTIERQSIDDDVKAYRILGGVD